MFVRLSFCIPYNLFTEINKAKKIECKRQSEKIMTKDDILKKMIEHRLNILIKITAYDKGKENITTPEDIEKLKTELKTCDSVSPNDHRQDLSQCENRCDEQK